MTDQTARRFMNVGEVYGGKSNIMLDLKPIVLYELAAPSTPDDVRELIEQKVSTGESVSLAEVKQLKKGMLEAKEQAQQSGKEVDKLRTENKMLIDGADAARLQARQDAKLEVKDSIMKLEAEIEDIQKRHEQEVTDLASTKTREQMDAQSGEIKRLNRLKKEKEEAIEALERSSSRIDQNIAEKNIA